ncbi:MAG: hypothetical protein P4N59_30765 [Negativicutes bacterium]|nr:hypothetical protein [Negativicutes bacterium]
MNSLSCSGSDKIASNSPGNREPQGDVVVIVIRGGKVVRFENTIDRPGVEGVCGDGI